jgi:transcriptional regulator with XRE-family HTH domain
MGVEPDYIGQLEMGKKNPTILTISNAAEALGVQAAVLVCTVSPSSTSTTTKTYPKPYLFEI